MIDLGTWASEQYTVPGGKADDHQHPDDGEHTDRRESADDPEPANESGARKLLH